MNITARMKTVPANKPGRLYVRISESSRSRPPPRVQINSSSEDTPSSASLARVLAQV